MLLISIVLFVVNIFLIIFSYFAIKNKFSDKNSIQSIKFELQKLISKIAFETDMAVSILEDKIKEANSTIAKLEKIILLADSEKKKREEAHERLSNLYGSGIEQTAALQDKKQPKKKSDEHRIVEEKEEIDNTDSANSKDNSVKIYTVKTLTGDGNIPIKIPVEEQVIELARKGFSREVIAEKTQLPAGEIELLISMNNI